MPPILPLLPALQLVPAVTELIIAEMLYLQVGAPLPACLLPCLPACCCPRAAAREAADSARALRGALATAARPLPRQRQHSNRPYCSTTYFPVLQHKDRVKPMYLYINSTGGHLFYRNLRIWFSFGALGCMHLC